MTKGACFSRVRPTPLSNPRLVAHSLSALHLLGLSPDKVTLHFALLMCCAVFVFIYDIIMHQILNPSFIRVLHPLFQCVHPLVNMTILMCAGVTTGVCGVHEWEQDTARLRASLSLLLWPPVWTLLWTTGRWLCSVSPKPLALSPFRLGSLFLFLVFTNAGFCYPWRDKGIQGILLSLSLSHARTHTHTHTHTHTLSQLSGRGSGSRRSKVGAAAKGIGEDPLLKVC